METITFSEIFQIFKKNIKYIILIALVTGFMGFFYGSRHKTDYEGKASLIIAKKSNGEITYNEMIINEKLTNILDQIIKSSDIYVELADDLSLKDEAESIQAKVKTEANPATGVINFSYTDTSKEKTDKVLTGLCQKLTEKSKDYLHVDNIEYLQNVTITENSKKMDKIKSTLLGLILGVMGSVTVIFVKEISLGKIYSPDYISSLGIEVLGEIDD